MPIKVDIKIDLSFDKALNIWKPKTVDKLTNKIMGEDICNGRIDLSKFSPNRIKIISI